MHIHEFRELIDKIDDDLSEYDNPKVSVVVCGRGIGATPSSEVDWISIGFDWNSRQIMLHTKDRLQKNLSDIER